MDSFVKTYWILNGSNAEAKTSASSVVMIKITLVLCHIHTFRKLYTSVKQTVINIDDIKQITDHVLCFCYLASRACLPA